MNLEDPLSDEYEDEDDFKDIQKLIENTKRNSRGLATPSEVERFLSEVNLA